MSARHTSVLGLVSAVKSGIGIGPLPTALGDAEPDRCACWAGAGADAKLAVLGPSRSQAHAARRGVLRFRRRRTRGAEIDPDRLERHHDLAEMLVGFHVLERLADVVEGKHLVDRQLQFARSTAGQMSFRTSAKISRISSIERVRKVTPI